jgi:Ca2+/H+ antiporter
MSKTKSPTDVDIIKVHHWKLILSLCVALVSVTAYAFTMSFGTFEMKSHAKEAHDRLETAVIKIEEAVDEQGDYLQKICLLFEASLKESQHPYKRRSSICSE